jgi:hypothetical protein
MPHIGYGVIVYAASQRRLNIAFKASLRYIHSLRKLDRVSYLETSVMGALLADYAISIHALCFHYFVLSRPRVRLIW